ncbi:hypothetical protein ACVR0O_01580 [Streptococcus caviae]|uniref:hypothetical protein n=1 Tax=Streptococcus sp. 'caviae' TaxID=1915004 RepID=UPI00094BC5A0|nr:hypothetical protein [Streptococcus sp. 'caviae']OLN84576.1 hypothetical protein BMI76_00405 [Streptococcus sp. 'caviae']
MTLQERVEKLEKQLAYQDEELAELAEKVYMDKPLSVKFGEFMGFVIAILLFIIAVVGIIGILSLIIWYLFR